MLDYRQHERFGVHYCHPTSVLCGTLTRDGLQVATGQGELKLLSEGKTKKFINDVEWVTINWKEMKRKDQEVLYVTERAVFELGKEGLVLKEIAPGVDLKKDILNQMEFRPNIASNLKQMDHRIFKEEDMGLRQDLIGCKETSQPIKRIYGQKVGWGALVQEKND